MRTSPRCAKILYWLATAGLWLGARQCPAQERGADDVPRSAAIKTVDAKTGSESKTAGEAEASDAKRPDSLPAADKTAENGELFQDDIRYLKGPDGRPVAVPDKGTLAEFLKWLAQRKEPPAASVSSLALEGTAGDERLYVTARIEIEVTTDGTWVKVPLHMAEATLRDSAVYSGKGLAVPAPFHPEEGHSWWIKGRGAHVLTLPLSIPFRRQATQNRVQLALPATAVSKLNLRVASPRVRAKVSERSTMTIKAAPAPAGAAGTAPQTTASKATSAPETEIEVIGLGNRLDLEWQLLPDSSGAETALEVTTSIVATLVDGESVTLEAAQRIQSLGQQGTFDELHVALPAGYELLKLDGPEHVYKTDPANPNQAVVQLKKGTTGPIDLKWTVRSKLPSVGESFALEGFEVDRARLQTGYLAVVVVGDFRIVPQEDKFLQRVDLVDLPGALRQTPASAAYRFLNRLLLRMKLQRIEPYVTVDPTLLLYFSSDSAELEGAFRLQVLRGSIGSFRLRWPKWKQQGWTIGEAELPGHVELRTIEETSDPDLVRFDFAEPGKGTIDLRFRARCALENVGERFPMTLPFVESYHRFPTLLAVFSADNVEANLRPAESTLLRPVNQPGTRISAPNEWRALRRSDYRMDPTQSELEVALSVHPRKIQGTTQIDASIRSSAVTVRQTIVYDVAYERISQLRFAMPEGLSPGQLRFFAQNGDELPALQVPASGTAPAEIRVSLESPAIGRFDVEVRYALSGLQLDPGARETGLSIPMVHSNDVVLSEARLTCRDAAGRDISVEGDRWQRRLSPEGLPVWIMPEVPAAVALKITHAAAAPNGTQISKTLIRSIVAAEGTILSRAQYVLAEGISELSVGFPRDVEPITFWWNRRPLRAVPAVEGGDGVTRYELVFTERATNGDRLLTIDFSTKSLQFGRIGARYALVAPQLPEDLRASQIYWQVELPYHEHLFTEPDGFSPEYRWTWGSWTRGRPFWSRDSQMSVAELEQWIGSQAGPPGLLSASAGENRYLFGTFGDPPPLAFRAMRQWCITLIGAGSALLLGLALLWRPALRHAVTFLAIAFLVAVLGIWYPAPVQLLLQPAILGVVLALVAAAIESFLKRNSRGVTVTLTSPSGFMTPASSHPRSPAVGVGSNEFTSLRSPPETSQASGQLSESGNRL
jgi:hypothetical protein